VGLEARVDAAVEIAAGRVGRLIALDTDPALPALPVVLDLR